ncbi:MAG: alpha/beta hydrolase fold domain-containing protein [Pyrinomonadaceae bacterium]|nr:alpha/beta hydrolase fold domain-containing protein [Pyrinomonadaceae bacterium]
MKKLLSFLLLFTFACSGEGQTKLPCTAGRYEKDQFTISPTKTVQYGTNKGWNGETVNLQLDIFEPKGDTATLRPLIIFAHGGGYVQGTKEDMTYFAQQFTKKGYVTASISYRLIPMDKIYDPNNMKREIVKAMSDFKSAIRFFRQSASNGNPYKIDANNIFIGGASAGAITALHIGLLDEKDQMPADFAKFVADEGGLEGNTGTPESFKFSSKIKGVINYSGSILEENWIDKDDAPIFSYHGTADDVVPIGYGITGKSFNMYGSESIKKKADEVGLFSILVKAPNGGHTNIYLDANFANYYIDFHNQVYSKMRSMMCGAK